MSLRHYSNSPATTLAVACAAADASITLESTAGLPIQYPYILILDRGTGTEEVVLVTNAAGSVLTVTRGYDDTPAFAHAIAASVEHGISAIDPREANAHVNATSDVHGVVGDLMGTSTIQTVTNKDLSSATNTFPATLATDAEVTSAVSGHNVATGVHGVTGAVVGTTDAQTLTNKTLDATANTLNGFTADRILVSDATGKAVASTAALPSSGSVVGTTATQTLTNKTLTDPVIVDSDGWTPYVPAVSGWTLGNGAVGGAYYQLGKVVFWRLSFQVGSSTVASGQLVLSLPVAGLAGPVVGSVRCVVSALPSTNRAAVAYADTSTTLKIAMGDGGVLADNTPGAWSVTDTIDIAGMYEAA